MLIPKINVLKINSAYNSNVETKLLTAKESLVGAIAKNKQSSDSFRLSKLEISPMAIPVRKAEQMTFLKNVIANNNKSAEKVLKTYDFAQHGKDGIPLKYKRDEFISDLVDIVEPIKSSEQENVLKRFGLSIGEDDLDGIPRIPDVLEKTEVNKKISNLINRFTIENETLIKDEETKKVLDSLIKGFPEFTSTIGKKQHGTHAYSVDIHSLKVLQDSMNNPLYGQLSDSSKTTLKLATLMHDFGKKGNVVTSGHATQSGVYSDSILTKFRLSENLKNRINKHVLNHHWFEYYNKGQITEMAVAKVFGSKEDMKIALAMAKSDFSSVSKDFHLCVTESYNEKAFSRFMMNKTAKIREYFSL